MSLIYWDTMLWIYQFEDHDVFGPRVAEMWEKVAARKDRLCLSTQGAAEVLTGPRRDENWDLYSRYLELFRSPELHLLDFSLTTAEVYADIRSRYKIAPADAVHLACAAEARVDLFLTHDRRLTGKFIPGIQFIASLDTEIL
ncbi:MAG: PIN domain-containing protein [Acidobacteria bacterium]|nr:PIN domain-containing protein [Acidobacteriota bacterium]